MAFFVYNLQISIVLSIYILLILNRIYSITTQIIYLTSENTAPNLLTPIIVIFLYFVSILLRILGVFDLPLTYFVAVNILLYYLFIAACFILTSVQVYLKSICKCHYKNVQF